MRSSDNIKTTHKRLHFLTVIAKLSFPQADNDPLPSPLDMQQNYEIIYLHLLILLYALLVFHEDGLTFDLHVQHD